MGTDHDFSIEFLSENTILLGWRREKEGEGQGEGVMPTEIMPFLKRESYIS